MQASHHKSHCLQHVAKWWKPCHVVHNRNRRIHWFSMWPTHRPSGGNHVMLCTRGKGCTHVCRHVVMLSSCQQWLSCRDAHMYAQEERDAHIGSAGLPGYRLRVLGHFFKHCNEEATGIRVMRQNAHASLQRELVCLSVWKHTLGQLVSLILQHENTGSNNRCTNGMQNPVQPFLGKRKFVVETSHARPGPAITHPYGVFLRRNRTHRGQNVTIEKGC